MKTSPTQRSLKFLRESGWTVQVVEHWNAFARRRIDVFHFGDIIGVNPELPDAKPTLFQVTSGANVSARLAKAREHAGPLTAWVLSGGRLQIHGWQKRGPRGQRKAWTVRILEVGLAELNTLDSVKDAT